MSKSYFTASLFVESFLFVYILIAKTKRLTFGRHILTFSFILVVIALGVRRSLNVAFCGAAVEVWMEVKHKPHSMDSLTKISPGALKFLHHRRQINAETQVW